MAEVLFGTADGVFTMTVEAKVEREEGPPSASFLAAGHHSVFAITEDGGLWEREQTGTWREVNPKCVPDEVWTFGAEPRISGRLYLGVSPALLYLTDDGGYTWRPCDSIRGIPGYETWTFPPPPHIPHVRSTAADPKVAGGVYIGVEEGGVYLSRDGGESWASLNEGLHWDVHAVAAPSVSDALFATTGNGFYRSDDGGQHWLRSNKGLDRGYTVTFLALERDPGVVLVAAAAGPPPTWSRGADAALYRSEDNGDSWTRITSGLPDPLDRMVATLREANDGTIYAGVGNEIFVSKTSGRSWRLLASGLPPVIALLPL